jgi:acetyl esterase/lipase
MMSEPVYLPLRTASGGKLVHKFYIGTDEENSLFVTLPGDHYGVDGPLLYYPAMALRRAGWSTLALTYGYQSAGEPFAVTVLPDMVEEASAAVREAIARVQPGRICLAGKSLGAALITTLAATMDELESARLVYMTPPLTVPLFAPGFRDTRQPSLVLVGTADRFYDRQVLEALRSERPFDLLEIVGADHSLIVEGGMKETLKALEQTVEKVLSFIQG